MYYSPFSYNGIELILGVIFAIAATILACIFIVPAARRENMQSRFFIFLHDIFNFKQLFIEVILKFVYILATFTTIFVGFFSLFSRYNSAIVSFAVIILGPIVIRISYELVMLIILLVKNTIEINSKLPVLPSQQASKTSAPPIITNMQEFDPPESDDSPED